MRALSALERKAWELHQSGEPLASIASTLRKSEGSTHDALRRAARKLGLGQPRRVTPIVVIVEQPRVMAQPWNPLSDAKPDWLTRTKTGRLRA